MKSIERALGYAIADGIASSEFIFLIGKSLRNGTAPITDENVEALRCFLKESAMLVGTQKSPLGTEARSIAVWLNTL